MEKAGRIFFYAGLIGLVHVIIGVNIVGGFCGVVLAAPGAQLKPFTNQISFEYEGESTFAIYGSSRAAAKAAFRACKVEGPNRRAVYRAFGSGTVISVRGQAWHYDGSFSNSTPGKYTITCGGVLKDQQLMLGPPMHWAAKVGRVMNMVAGVTGIVVFAGVTALGFIMWIRGREDLDQPSRLM
ncbi:hypothetical protein GCM10009585_05390 [Brevibacterium paucivorans]|uniref:hypothetical protein n=1 Tax=Brevibacterium paucivorans TaxID=170994 RepID=UPI0031D4D51E